MVTLFIIILSKTKSTATERSSEQSGNGPTVAPSSAAKTKSTATERSSEQSGNGPTVAPTSAGTVCRARTSTNITPKKTVFIPGESAKIVCEPPSRTHTKKREDTVTCRNDGSWSFSIDCEETICKITPEDNVQSSPYWHYTFRYKHRLPSHSCRRGFKTSGGSTCEVEGWVPPLCSAITCNPEIPNAIILSENKTYKFNEHVEYECKLFHEPEGKQNAYCGVNGWEWPNCKAKENYCKRPDLENGYHINVKSNASVIYYSCVSGYKPFVEGWWDELTCKKSEWSDIPKCIDETACVRPTILNSKQVRKDLYSNGESLTFECEDAYEMEGTGQIKCVNGEWESPLPVCKPSGNSCNPPPRVEDATITSKYKTKYAHQSTVQFQCRDLYVIQGNREVTCTSGTWSDIPKCISKTATGPSSEQSGEMIATPSPEKYICEKPVLKGGFVDPSRSTYYEGDILEYQCFSPCKPKTNRNIACMKGQWSDRVECTCFTSCEPPQEIPFGDIKGLTKDVYNTGETVEYQCKNYYVLSGREFITCRNGVWDDPPKCLEPCTVTLEEMDQRGIRLRYKHPTKVYVKHDERIVFSCGYRKNLTDGEFINWCRHGRIHLPSCA